MNRHPMRSLLAILPLTVVTSACLYMRASADPPPGFTSLFDGKDLTGWWGAAPGDPRKHMAKTSEGFKKKHYASLQDMDKHWSVQGDELVNDGEGLYLTTEKYYGDFEL